MLLYKLNYYVYLIIIIYYNYILSYSNFKRIKASNTNDKYDFLEVMPDMFDPLSISYTQKYIYQISEVFRKLFFISTLYHV